MKKEREDKAARREKWAKRKRLPKRDPINSEIYNLPIRKLFNFGGQKEKARQGSKKRF